MNTKGSKGMIEVNGFCCCLYFLWIVVGVLGLLMASLLFRNDSAELLMNEISIFKVE